MSECLLVEEENHDLLNDFVVYVEESNHTMDEVVVIKEIQEAFERKDQWYISFYRCMGEDARQRVMNINEFNHAKKFGFKVVKFDEYGWAEFDLINKDEIEFALNDKFKGKQGNLVNVASGLNGKWTYGLWYTFFRGGGGGCFSPSVFREIYNSKQDAILAGMEDLLRIHKAAIESYKNWPDKTNTDIDKVKAFVKMLEEEIKFKTKPKLEQLALF